MFWTVYQFSYYSIIAKRINAWIFVRVHFLLLLAMIRGAIFNWLSNSLNSLKRIYWYTLYARVLANICSLYLLGLLFVLRQNNILSVRKSKCGQSLHRYLYHVSNFLYHFIYVNYIFYIFSYLIRVTIDIFTRFLLRVILNYSLRILHKLKVHFSLVFRKPFHRFFISW